MRRWIGAIAAAVLAALAGACTTVNASRTERAEEAFPPTGELLRIGETTVHAHVAGTGPTIILIHGASGNARDFTFSLVEDLARDYRVIAFDRPGLGWTDRLPGTTGALNTDHESAADQARLLDAAARALGVERAVVVGHSYGGAVALAWALEAPERVAGLALFAAPSHPWDGGLGALYRINASALGGAVAVPLLSALAPPSRLEETVADIFAPQSPPPGYLAHVGAPLSLRPESLRANAQQVNGLLPEIELMAPRYPALTLPIELIHGDADTIVPLAIHSRRLAERAPGARLQVLPGVGHMPHHADPAAARAAIDRAVARAGLR
ncbi:alpha/beta fold hydrolase [Poseidonocella sedimentorum]|uniref:Pimeloyl-ACP methyl ester carboxylesterase n=1 Tax=Poseidonocella sedimentorum TaxID=871652 RepID=A0A1I6EJF4_9RHOB|nr:alpha/beta fold hydrolase [Poseidonocella sedimentorum]SFR17906.1 Pimeloyl-ACP methyl ester carboxylesterase [Poseidonocella sedimentorum]